MATAVKHRGRRYFVKPVGADFAVRDAHTDGPSLVKVWATKIEADQHVVRLNKLDALEDDDEEDHSGLFWISNEDFVVDAQCCCQIWPVFPYMHWGSCGFCGCVPIVMDPDFRRESVQ